MASRSNPKEDVIEEVIEEVIKQVESHKIDVPMHTSKSTDSPVSKSKRHRSGNRKIRVRHKKHKWKPYCKMTWEERKRLEERDTRRAFKIREKMSASGLTLAPYNTTQFLMEDHNITEPDFDSMVNDSKSKEESHSYDSEDFYSSPDDEEEFLQREFSETYDSFHEAYINSLTKFELVRELMRLEDEIEVYEKSLDSNIRRSMSLDNPNLDVQAELEKIQVFQGEIEKLTEENFLLDKENEELKNRLSLIKSAS